jgi:general secretion pathway protein E
MIFKKCDINELKTYLEKINFKTILDDGKQKVALNQTSLDEVYKVISY